MTTSKKTASQAGKDLRDKKTPKKDRGPIRVGARTVEAQEEAEVSNLHVGPRKS